MSLLGITKTAILLEKRGAELTSEEKQFVYQFAFQTEDTELTEELIAELVVKEEDSQSIQMKYEAICDSKPAWMKQMEDLLVALELYRLEEEKAINRLANLLGAYGITVTEDEIRSMEVKDIEERVKKNNTI